MYYRPYDNAYTVFSRANTVRSDHENELLNTHLELEANSEESQPDGQPSPERAGE